MIKFTFTLKHDKGKIHISTYSDTKQAAIEKICKAENCPESALTFKMERLTIYDIKQRTEATSPYYFTRKTLKFFGQRMKDFSVRIEGDKYRISAPMIDRFTGRKVGVSERLFNPETNELEFIAKP